MRWWGFFLAGRDIRHPVRDPEYFDTLFFLGSLDALHLGRISPTLSLSISLARAELVIFMVSMAFFFKFVPPHADTLVHLYHQLLHGSELSDKYEEMDSSPTLCSAVTWHQSRWATGAQEM